MLVANGDLDVSIISVFYDSDPIGIYGNYSATVYWGDGTQSAATSLISTFATFTASHTYAFGGTYAITVWAFDDGGASASTTMSYVLQPTNGVAVEGLTSSVPVARAELVGTSFDMSRSYIEDIGDGTTVNFNVSAPDANSIVTLSASHTYANEGIYLARTRMAVLSAPRPCQFSFCSDPLALTRAHVTVRDAPLVPENQLAVSGLEGTNGTFTVARFTDQNPAATAGDFHATINWGDGRSSDALVTPGGSFLVSGNHAYADNGVYHGIVSIFDVGGSTLTTGFTASVANVAPSNLVLTADPSVINEGSTTTLVGSFSDPGTLDTHTVTINWGDGSAATTLGLTANVRSFTVSHRYLDNPAGKATGGSFGIVVTVADKDGGVVSNTAAPVAVVVNDVAPVVTFTNTPYAVREGTRASAVYLFTYSVFDPGILDTIGVTTSCGPAGTKVAGSDTFSGTSGSFQCRFSGTLVGDGPATTQVSAVARDNAGLVGPVATQTFTVLNVNPVVTIVDPANLSIYKVGKTVKVDASFTDAGISDAPHRCSVNWGDGNVTSGVVTESSGSGFCSASHAYGAAGTYRVVVTITDKDGGSGSASLSIVVRT
jgi:hypothetical protein